MKDVVRLLAGSCLVVLLSGVLMGKGDGAEVASKLGSAPEPAQVHQRMSGLAVPFEANIGQQDERVAFTARSLGASLFVTHAGALVYSFPGLPVAGQDPRDRNRRRGPGWVLTETLVDARPEVRGEAPSVTRVSRFNGLDPAGWRSSVPTFERVALGEPWPGIEVALAARGNNMEKLFTVAPGAEPRRIAIRLDGAERLELDGNGALIAHTGNGPVSFTAPRAWQDIKGERKPVKVAYALAGDRYGFHLRGYNRAYPVVIDPLLQSTYLGGSGSDTIYGIALDSSGNVFVAGMTTSANFPGVNTSSPQQSYAGPSSGPFVGDAFVAKLNNGLTTLIHATYLGGNSLDQARAIAVDSTSGEVFIAGGANSNFPVTSLAAQATGGAFVAKLDNGLTTLTASTRLGGTGLDGANAIALAAPGGDIYVAGTTTGGFPGTAGGAQATFGGSGNSGSGDAFVVRLNNALTAISQATYLGGSLDDIANGIAVDWAVCS